jgi:hypothetical protein
MKTSRFGDLGRLTSGAAPRLMAGDPAEPPSDVEDENEPDDEVGGQKKKKDEEMDDIDTNSENYKAGQAAAMSEATRKANERVSTVVASEHYVGREKLAANLLKSDMSAEAIVGALADAPVASKAGESDAGKNDDDDDRQLMREQLRGNNPNLGNEDEGDKDAAAKAKADNYGWEKIHAEIDERQKA